MISLCYNLLVLLNDHKFPCLVTDKFEVFNDHSGNMRETYLGVLGHKEQVSLYQMSQNLPYLSIST